MSSRSDLRFSLYISAGRNQYYSETEPDSRNFRLSLRISRFPSTFAWHGGCDSERGGPERAIRAESGVGRFTFWWVDGKAESGREADSCVRDQVLDSSTKRMRWDEIQGRGKVDYLLRSCLRTSTFLQIDLVSQSKSDSISPYFSVGSSVKENT